MLDASQLVETIYRNAVEKKNSSSSEDDIMELSGEDEMAKAKIFNSTGEQLSILQKPIRFDSIAQMDQDYLLVGNHVDKGTQTKIIQGEYVDFGKLLPKDKVLSEEDGRMELVVKYY